MLVLGFGWLLLGVELLWGLTPALELLGTVIWLIFILDFLLKFVLAPHKLAFLKQNIITLISLLVPALRSLQLVKAIGSLNRGMKALAASFGRRGVGYVLGLTGVLRLLDAAASVAGIKDYRAVLAGNLVSTLLATLLMGTLGLAGLLARG